MEIKNKTTIANHLVLNKVTLMQFHKFSWETVAVLSPIDDCKRHQFILFLIQELSTDFCSNRAQSKVKTRHKELHLPFSVRKVTR